MLEGHLVVTVVLVAANMTGPCSLQAEPLRPRTFLQIGRDKSYTVSIFQIRRQQVRRDDT
jgi:hypothetical protein